MPYSQFSTHVNFLPSRRYGFRHPQCSIQLFPPKWAQSLLPFSPSFPSSLPLVFPPSLPPTFPLFSAFQLVGLGFIPGEGRNPSGPLSFPLSFGDMMSTHSRIKASWRKCLIPTFATSEQQEGLVSLCWGGSQGRRGRRPLTNTAQCVFITA